MKNRRENSLQLQLATTFCSALATIGLLLFYRRLALIKGVARQEDYSRSNATYTLTKQHTTHAWVTNVMPPKKCRITSLLPTMAIRQESPYPGVTSLGRGGRGWYTDTYTLYLYDCSVSACMAHVVSSASPYQLQPPTPRTAPPFNAAA